MRDSLNAGTTKRVLSPVATAASDAAQVGEVVDHQGYESAVYEILTGSLPDADATFTVLLEESDASGSGFAAVADADMISQGANAPETDASFTFAADNQVRTLGYKGQKRYTRMTITPLNNASASLLAVCCRLGHRRAVPFTQPTA